MSFVKLYGSIIHSSIWSEPDHVRIVWLTMLAMSTYQGVVEASVGGIAHAARVSMDHAKEALQRLQGPDPDSRDGTTGERIRKVPGGWEIINHNRYRDMRSPRQVKQAEYQRRYEQRLKGAQAEQSEKNEHQPMLSPSLSPSSYRSPSAESPGTEKKKAKPPGVQEVQESADFQRFWTAYDKKVGIGEAAKSWLRLAPDAALVDAIIKAAENYRLDAPDKAYRKNPATWLNQRGWLDERIVPAISPSKTGIRQTGAVVSGLRVVHPANMPVPYDSPIDPCHCGACVGARKRKENA